MKPKFQIGRFAVAFFACLVFDLLIGIASLLVAPDSPAIIRWLVSFLNTLIAYPLNFIDRTYPYHTIGPLWFQLMLTGVNTLFQATVLFILWNKVIKNRRKSGAQKMN